MILTDDLRAVFERWDIDPNDPNDMAYYQQFTSQGDIHAELTDIETTIFQGSDDEMYRYLAEADKQLRADAAMLWEWIKDDCVTEPPDAPQTRVWDGEAYRLDI